jgi:hypothetical protein
MRTGLLLTLCLVLFVPVAAEKANPDPGQFTILHAIQLRTPDTGMGSSNPYPQLAPRHPPDPVQLKSDAQDLQKLADSVPAQVDQVTKGQLPKDLIENLKKIEKLSKHLRSEVSQ